MSTKPRHPQDSTDLPDDDHAAKPVLALVVRRTTQYDHLPDWDECQTAEWAIQDTIERVAPEAKR